MSGRSTPAVPFLDLTTVNEVVLPEVRRGWAEVVDTNAFIGGPAVSVFEGHWASFCGTRHAVGMANGTDALHLTLRALGIGPGDEVIVPANTFVATAEAVVLAGASPRFADVDPGTLLITPETMEEVAGPRTRAVVVVHLYGQTPDMDALMTAADRLGLLLVEDAAQAHGATWQERRAGSFGVAGCFSFYPGKNLGAFGDAGAVVTDDDGLADRLRSMRDHGRVAGGHYEHGVVGTNSRLDTLQAVVLDAKLAHLDAWNESRRQIADTYRRLLDPRVARMVERVPGARGVCHLAVVRVSERAALRAHLAEQGIGTGIHYPTPCHLMAPYSGFAEGPLPAAERAADEVLSLPMYPGMGTDRAEWVSGLVNEFAHQTVLA